MPAEALWSALTDPLEGLEESLGTGLRSALGGGFEGLRQAAGALPADPSTLLGPLADPLRRVAASLGVSPELRRVRELATQIESLRARVASAPAELAALVQAQLQGALDEATALVQPELQHLERLLDGLAQRVDPAGLRARLEAALFRLVPEAGAPLAETTGALDLSSLEAVLVADAELRSARVLVEDLGRDAADRQMRRELEKTNQNAAEQSQQEKERFDAVQQELEAEAKKRQSLADSMDKLDMDTVRIRGDIDRVERERREALAETQAKRAASERQLADLRAELGKKASEQETTRIKADIARVEQGNEELTREAAANQAKVAAYDRQIAELETQLRGKIKEQGQIRAQLATAETTLATLQKETLRLNAADLPKQIDDMKQRPRALRRRRRPSLRAIRPARLGAALLRPRPAAHRHHHRDRALAQPLRRVRSPAYSPGRWRARGSRRAPCGATAASWDSSARRCRTAS